MLHASPRILTHRSGSFAVTETDLPEPAHLESIYRSRLLEEAGETTIRQGFTAGLAGRAVLKGRISERDLTHGVATNRALLSGAAMDPQAGLLLTLEVLCLQSAGALHGVLKGGDDRLVQGRRPPE